MTVCVVVSWVEHELDGFVVQGIKTTIPLHKRILADPQFVAGKFDTHFLERLLGAPGAK